MRVSDHGAMPPGAIRLRAPRLTRLMIATPALLLVRRETRGAGLAVGAADAAVAVGTQALFAQFGFVRLVGSPRGIVWRALLLYLACRLRRGVRAPVPRAAAAVFAVSLRVSLAFDAAGVARRLAGERAPFV